MPVSVAAAMLLALTLASGGCVAMNIPSHRLHDAADRGGMLGGWLGSGANGGCHDGSVGYGGGCHDNTFVDQAFGDDLTDERLVPPAPKPDPVPWPRYHPIPTRPAFSPMPGQSSAPISEVVSGAGPY